MNYDDERDTDPAMPIYTPFADSEDAPYAHLLLSLRNRARRGEHVHVPQEIAHWHHANRLIYARSALWSVDMRRFVADYSSEEEV